MSKYKTPKVRLKQFVQNAITDKKDYKLYVF